MSKLDELGLTEDKIEIPDEVPEQMGNFFPPPQPATYTFRLPEDLGEVWDTFETDAGQRISARFDRDYPLHIVDSPDGSYNGTTLMGVSISNSERARGREKVMVADMYYLIQALYKDEDMPDLGNNPAFAKALINKAGAKFKADVEWSARCSESSDMWVTGPDGNAVQEPGTPGCGKSFYTSTSDSAARIPQDENGHFLDRFECALTGCDGGACLRAFPRLSRFKAA
jgi:hypothetical protein